MRRERCAEKAIFNIYLLIFPNTTTIAKLMGKLSNYAKSTCVVIEIDRTAEMLFPCFGRFELKWILSKLMRRTNYMHFV